MVGAIVAGCFLLAIIGLGIYINFVVPNKK